MANQFKINEIIVNNILKNVLIPNTPCNNEHIFNIIMRELPDHAKEIILHLSLSKDEYNTVGIGDFVTLEPLSYHPGSEFEWDILEDMGLSPGNGRVYGKVTGDSSWGNEKFNPFYSSIKVDLYYHDKQKKLKIYDHQVNPLDLTKVNESDIKYFDILDTDVVINQEELFPDEKQE
tara:strand:- start:1787 stop:2314 length:528 start_codon:yes stop_codon:yes gene_type:complete